MINKEKISIYKKYNGNLDAWAQIATFEEKEKISDDDWYLIDGLIQDIVISKSDLLNLLKRNVEDKETLNEILKIAIEETW